MIFVMAFSVNLYISSVENNNSHVRNTLLKAFDLMESNDGASAKNQLLKVIPNLTNDHIFPFFTSVMAMVTYGFLKDSEEIFQASKAFINNEFSVIRDGKQIGKSKLACLIIPSAYGMKINGTKDFDIKINFLVSIMQKYSIKFDKQYCKQSALGPGESDIPIEDSFYEIFPQIN